MALCVNRRGDVFEEFIEITEEEAQTKSWDHPLTHALVAARNRTGYLLVFDTWKKHWEVPGGILEEGETLQECALREMLEETNQIPAEICFMGVMKFRLANGKTEYGGLFSAWIEEERSFSENEEVEQIIFWDGKEEIGSIDEIDRFLVELAEDRGQFMV